MAQGLNLKRGHELNTELRRAKKLGSSEKIDERRYFSSEFRPNPKNHSFIFIALKNKWFFVVDFLLSRGDHFGAVNFSGKFAGFTALHHACLLEDEELVLILLERYNVDPSVQASNGVEPIQLAAFLGRFDIVQVLVKFGISIDTELSFSLFKKYAVESQTWNSSFKEKMTLFTYIVFNNHYGKPYSYPTVMFLLHNPTLSVCDSNNRTLLMHVIENEQWAAMMSMAQRLGKQELNRRDDFGYTAIHVILAKMMAKKYQEGEDGSEVKEDLSCWMQMLIHNGAEVNVMVNGDPTTLPIHIAAYHGFYIPMMFLLEAQQLFFSSLARPLFHLTQGLDNFRTQKDQQETSDRIFIAILELIIEDIYIKRFLKYPVHKEEVKLMEQLIAEDNYIKEFVKRLDEKCVILTTNLKKSEVLFGERKMALYDVLTAPQKEYFAVAKDKDSRLQVDVFHFDYLKKLSDLARSRLEKSKERIQILEKWQEIATPMIKSLLVPYDCVLDIVEYMTNEDLESLIEAYSINGN